VNEVNDMAVNNIAMDLVVGTEMETIREANMVNKLVQQGMESVEATLMTVIDSEIELLNDASRHILTSGGKRLRPHVALLSYLAAGGENISKVVPMATAIEMVHTATLVHDDINDHSLVRRGRPAVHARWGRTFALLTGDYLFTKVYQLMAPYDSSYNVIMADACSELVEGETLQAATAKAGKMDRETYKRIVSLKTASLFDAAARMGAMLAGAEDEVVHALARYAYHLGIAFQIVDDVLDVIGDPEMLGKPVGSDLAQQRGVLATQETGAKNGRSLLSLHHETGYEMAVVQQPSAAEADTDVDPIQQMMNQLRDSGAIELARLQAIETAARARQSLKDVPPSPARDELEALVDAVLERDH
jgi:geranylgeranyl pyrophosphate synthase